MNPDFDVAFWRHQACTRGEIDTYDEATFQARQKRKRKKQLIVSGVVGSIAVIQLVIFCVVRGCKGFWIGVWIAIVLCTILPGLWEIGTT
jgi:hypothetical protein